MGSSRERTVTLIENLIEEGFDVVAHLACLGNSRHELVDLIHRYQTVGVRGILALRGDPPLDGGIELPESELHYASELVELVRQESDLPVVVALHPDGHPDSEDDASDRRHAAQKLAHADLGLTQFFFEYASFAGLRESMLAQGVKVPVVPGLMVPATPKHLMKMSQIAGLEPPASFDGATFSGDDGSSAFQSLALDAAVALAKKAIADGVRGVHLFSMNNARVTTEFFARLQVSAPA
jgi:methylenetetrahydrofolate reductase (NADPH)